MKIVLASESPRRNEILKSLGLNFETRKHEHNEENLDIKNPKRFVKVCSLKKALSTPRAEDELVVAADTIVYLQSRIIGKPKSKREAELMIRMLSGKRHSVYTGISILFKEKQECGAQKTDVFFRDICDSEIASYIETASFMDKAGAYAVQEEAALFVEKIYGDFFNVVGFPVLLFERMYERVTGGKLYAEIWKNKNKIEKF